MGEGRGKYCLICRKHYGPYLSKRCKPDSLVDTIKVGWLFKRIKFIDAVGNELDEEALQSLRTEAIRGSQENKRESTETGIGPVQRAEHDEHPGMKQDERERDLKKTQYVDRSAKLHEHDFEETSEATKQRKPESSGARIEIRGPITHFRVGQNGYEQTTIEVSGGLPRSQDVILKSAKNVDEGCKLLRKGLLDEAIGNRPRP